MIMANDDQDDQHPDRDERGHFLPGNKIGVGTRFPPGVSGNPGGSRNAGATLREWMNTLADKTVTELKAVAEDESLPALKNAAAYALLATTAEGREGRDAINLIIDRTLGRPAQSVQIEQITGADRAIAALQESLRVLSPERNDGVLPYYMQPGLEDDDAPEDDYEEADDDVA